MIKLLRSSLWRFSQAQTNPNSSHYVYGKDIPASVERTKLNLFQAVNSAMDIALETDHT